MWREIIRRCAIAIATWLPFFAIWTLVTISFGYASFSAVLVGSLISIGSAGLLGIAVWFACQRWPWPLGFKLRFYVLQILFAVIYGFGWTLVVWLLEYLRGAGLQPAFWSRSVVAPQVVMGGWVYAGVAGISHAVATRNPLHGKETPAARGDA